MGQWHMSMQFRTNTASETSYDAQQTEQYQRRLYISQSVSQSVKLIEMQLLLEK
jgi:hypothetical protein